MAVAAAARLQLKMAFNKGNARSYKIKRLIFLKQDNGPMT